MAPVSRTQPAAIGRARPLTTTAVVPPVSTVRVTTALAPAGTPTPADPAVGGTLPHPVQPQSGTAASAVSAVQSAVLKAVVIVGPSGAADTAANLVQAEDFAQGAEKYGMDVRRVYYPHATWKNVLANIDGANIVVYFGHGNGWPSPYKPFQEHTKDGFGLDSRDGAGPNDVTYYGATYIRQSVKLAPDSVVILSHLCYSAGNAEPGMPIPDFATAAQRVDNTASGFLAAGAGAVFAYATGSISPILDGLFGDPGKTIDQIFMAGGRHGRPYYGYVGWNDQYAASVRTPAAQSHLDPGRDEGYLRAVTGNLSLTAGAWRAAGS